LRKSTTVLKFTLQVIVSQLRKRMIFLANAKMFAVCLLQLIHFWLKGEYLNFLLWSGYSFHFGTIFRWIDVGLEKNEVKSQANYSLFAVNVILKLSLIETAIPQCVTSKSTFCLLQISYMYLSSFCSCHLCIHFQFRWYGIVFTNKKLRPITIHHSLASANMVMKMFIL